MPQSKRYGLRLKTGGAPNTPHTVAGLRGQFRPDPPTPVGQEGDVVEDLDVVRRALDVGPAVKAARKRSEVAYEARIEGRAAGEITQEVVDEIRAADEALDAAVVKDQAEGYLGLGNTLEIVEIGGGKVKNAEAQSKADLAAARSALPEARRDGRAADDDARFTDEQDAVKEEK